MKIAPLGPKKEHMNKCSNMFKFAPVLLAANNYYLHQTTILAILRNAKIAI